VFTLTFNLITYIKGQS